MRLALKGCNSGYAQQSVAYVCRQGANINTVMVSRLHRWFCRRALHCSRP